MNANDISLIIKSQNGGTWPDAVFNDHQMLRHVLDKAIEYFHLDDRLVYEVLLVRGTQQSLPLGQSLSSAGVRSGDQLLVRTIGRTVDGE